MNTVTKTQAMDKLQETESALASIAFYMKQQESEYITAEQARELGAGNAEWKTTTSVEGWNLCSQRCEYLEFSWTHNAPCVYRAVKQAQPEPVEDDAGFLKRFKDNIKADVDRCLAPEPVDEQTEWVKIEGVDHDPRYEQVVKIDQHAALRAEYAKQVAEGTTGFYLWECKQPESTTWGGTTYKKPAFEDIVQYRCTDISCMVSKDGEPAKRMLRTEAQELQRKTKDTHDWFDPAEIKGVVIMAFDGKGTYTYHTKATIKLNGNMVAPEQAAAEWGAKKETHDRFVKWSTKDFHELGIAVDFIPFDDNEYFEYELRPKALKIVKWSDIPVGVMTNKGAILLRKANATYPVATICNNELDWRSIYDLELAPASEQPWMYWGGGECPVPEGCMFEVTCRSGNVRQQEVVSDWTHTEHAGDIIAYRITGIAKGYVLEGAV